VITRTMRMILACKTACIRRYTSLTTTVYNKEKLTFLQSQQRLA
jgi:hypothetical protein